MKKKVLNWLILVGASLATGIVTMILGFVIYLMFTGYGGIQDYDLPYFIISSTVATFGAGIIIAIKQAVAEITKK